MTYTYHVPFTDDTYVQTYFAEIKGICPKFGFKRTFLEANTHDFGEDRGYYLTIWNEGVFEQSIKIFSRITNELIRQEKKWLLYDGFCMNEIERREVVGFVEKIRELAAL